jgi:hypothetical protein
MNVERRNLERALRAARALRAYVEAVDAEGTVERRAGLVEVTAVLGLVEGLDDDAATMIVDLVADLAHLVDVIGRAGLVEVGTLSGVEALDGLVERAAVHYFEEVDAMGV